MHCTLTLTTTCLSFAFVLFIYARVGPFSWGRGGGLAENRSARAAQADMGPHTRGCCLAQAASSSAGKLVQGPLVRRHERLDGGKKPGDRKWVASYAVVYKGILYFYKENPALLIDKQSDKAHKNLKLALDIRDCAVGLTDLPERSNLFAITTATGTALGKKGVGAVRKRGFGRGRGGDGAVVRAGAEPAP